MRRRAENRQGAQQGEIPDRDSESGVLIDGHRPALVTRFKMRHIATMVFGILVVAYSI